MSWLIALAVLGAAYAATCYRLHRRYPELRWDWDEHDTSTASFPPDFLWGTASASHQVEGGSDNNNWARWETQVDAKGKPRIHDGDRSGRACEHWERYREDIALMQQLGVRSYRFSLAWGKIEPEQGRYDEDAIQHYSDVIDALLEAGIEPMVTLHHFTHPLWFEDLGSFEHEENIEHLRRFGERMFRAYGDRVKRWCTHNEPGPFATMGWGLGVFPPGKQDPKLLARVLQNLVRSHVALYETIKGLPGGDEVEVGLVKNIFQFDPWRRWNLLDWALTRTLERVYNDSLIGVLRDGVFRIRVPFLLDVEVDMPDARGANDFIGLNYYSHLLLTPWMKREPPFEVLARPGDVPTDFPYVEYGEGFYRALMQIHTLGLPIYITECGIPDAKDDRRARFIERYLYAMSKAMADGADVRGFHYWSLTDNFEWAEGYSMRFGLYAMDFATQERTLRAGSAPFIEAVRASGSTPSA